MRREVELTAAPALVARVAWPGEVLTGDALFCQRDLRAQVLAAGRDYILLVKDNQPMLFADTDDRANGRPRRDDALRAAYSVTTKLSGAAGSIRRGNRRVRGSHLGQR